MLNSSTAISTFKVKTFQDNKESTYPFIEQRNDYGARKRKLSRRNQKRTPKVISKKALIMSWQISNLDLLNKILSLIIFRFS